MWPGVAPFAFDTLGDLRRRSGVVEAVLTEGLMPPRLAHERDAISGVRALGEAERQSLLGWLQVAESTSDGTPVQEAVDPLATLGEPDVVLRAEAAWSLPREGEDRTHCFRFPLPKTMTGIRAWHLDPGPGRAAVHHAGFLVDEEGVLRLWDEAIPRPVGVDTRRLDFEKPVTLACGARPKGTNGWPMALPAPCLRGRNWWWRCTRCQPANPSHCSPR